MFLQQCFYLLDTLGVLLPEDLISNGNKEHMAGNIPGQRGKGQYGKREKYKGCD
jgi:hypothetical protein